MEAYLFQSYAADSGGHDSDDDPFLSNTGYGSYHYSDTLLNADRTVIQRPSIAYQTSYVKWIGIYLWNINWANCGNASGDPRLPKSIAVCYHQSELYSATTGNYPYFADRCGSFISPMSISIYHLPNYQTGDGSYIQSYKWYKNGFYDYSIRVHVFA